MGNLENIQSHNFQPGRSGNPAGKRPGTRNRSTIARKILQTVIADGKFNKNAVTGEIVSDMDVEEVLYWQLAAEAKAGGKLGLRAMQMLLDSGYGRPVVPMEIRDAGEVLERDPREMTEAELRDAVAYAQHLRALHQSEMAEDAELAASEPEPLRLDAPAADSESRGATS